MPEKVKPPMTIAKTGNGPKPFPLVPLGEVLRRSCDTIPILADETYKEVTVRLWGKGVHLRREVVGSEMKADRRTVVKTGQFILSRIDARNGAFGIIPNELDGAVVSNDFPVFDVNQERLFPKFLEWMSKTSDFIELCKAASEGTTNRVRLKEERFLSATISLPPLSEQKRIVERIENVVEKVEEVRGLIIQAATETEALLAASSEKFLEKSWQHIQLDKLCPVITDGTHLTPRYVEVGAIFLSAQNVKPFRFMPEKHRKVSIEDFIGYTARNKPQRDDVLLTRVGSGIGEAAIVDQDIEFAIYVSLALIRTDKQLLFPKFLVHWLNSPVGRASSLHDTLGKGHSQGNLNLKLIREFMLPIPPLSEQRRIVTYLDALHAKVNILKILQAESAAELNAFLPSILDKAFKGEL